MASSEPSQPSARVGSRWSKPHVVLLLLGIIATASFLGSAYAFNWFGTSPLNCAHPIENVPTYVHFTIVISLSGYNDSAHHTLPWPIMNVITDSNVIIHVLNNDTSQPHGFAIKHYFEQGVVLQPGQYCALIFKASTSGTFAVYNTIVDTIDVYENAQLNVNPSP